ncbi:MULTISPECIES: acyltransferase family protein [Olivibacter]|jgi:peptidoglycan/LPS O-acetylase OafA/YrhL|uniref:Acyltransferase family protein n=1 Tax=Olivibacter oleidegradans TaxID=760123 RepID=A0ABV6HFT9_9SPHI|nr:MULTISPECIES: acyltransferase [Olivibacter]MDM8177839.1 acyltransferase [Olivibacter sp. 47]
MHKIASAAFADTKPHYILLDGLRGVAALMVIWYHIFEAFATSPVDQHFNHGYLAVDFFFILSGFVIGYAYDDRWKTMKVKDFIKRRLIRLHPMVIMGAILGAITFYIQGSVKWDGSKVSLSMLMLALLINLFLIPAAPGSGPEVRGNGEMYPLNGPSWSLFFEYIGNILYALFIRRLSAKALAVLVLLAGIGLASFAIFNFSGYGHLGVGWTMAGHNLIGGFLRLLFSFSAGVLMSRKFKPVEVKGAFWICSLAIIILLSIPHIGEAEALWMNGIYDALCTLVIFPILVYLGASGTTTGKSSIKICKFLGDISYPLYMVHYPFMYLFYAWVWQENLTFTQIWPITLLLFLGTILVAYLFLKLYDEPFRKWLSKKLLMKS